jgi:hypothetical protein
MDIGEYIFGSLAPRTIKTKIDQIAPLKCEITRSCKWRGIDMCAAVGTILTFGGVLFYFQAFLVPQTRHLEDARSRV